MQKYILMAICAWSIGATIGLAGESDPFRAEIVATRGRLRGQAIDTNQRRSIVLLSPAEAKRYTGSTAGYTFANFSHESTFCIAWVPREAVEEVIYQLEYFPAIVPAAHTQLRFKLKKGSAARLFPQPGNRAPKHRIITDLIFSAEAANIQGGPGFDLIAGMRDSFGLALRFISLEEKYNYMVTKQKHRVRQFSLSMNARQRQALLHNALRRSHVSGMTQMYHTLTRSCTTEVFDVLAITVQKHSDFRLDPLFGRVPTRSVHYLKRLGLLSPPTLGEHLDLNDEWLLREAGIGCEQHLLEEASEADQESISNPSERINA